MIDARDLIRVHIRGDTCERVEGILSQKANNYARSHPKNAPKAVGSMMLLLGTNLNNPPTNAALNAKCECKKDHQYQLEGCN